MSSVLALGTAQFGFDYGIANQGGRVSHDEVKAIIALAKSGGIDVIDTAIAYGESETSLGAIGVDSFKVITKLPAIPDEVTEVSCWVKDQIQASLKRLNVKSIYGVLLHRSQQLTDIKGTELSKVLKQLKVDGVVQKIGVSIYSPNELQSIMTVCEIDIVQAPFNILDQRLLTSGWLKKLHGLGVEVHTRSAFLQGLLLMPKASIPQKFMRWMSIFDQWHDWLKENDISAIQACIGFVQNFTQITKVVVGVETAFQLDELIMAAKHKKNVVWPRISCSDENLINPSNWNKF
jgi:aryl-alcohol dehydrogenase-like predicted oxidoreductase